MRMANVVVGTDGSYCGDKALRWAARHAWCADADLEVWLPGDPEALPADVPRDASLSHVCRDYPLLHLHIRASGPGLAHDLGFASVGADLLVVGSSDLATEARCDTVVVRGHSSAVQGAHHRITAFVDDDTTVLARAAQTALRHHARLRVVSFEAPSGEHQFALDQSSRYLEKLDPRPQYDVVPDTCRPEATIASAVDSDLLVLGDGSLARYALGHAPCPVLVLTRG
jgi:hypothetical protein